MSLSLLISVGNIVFALTLFAVFYTKNIWLKCAFVFIGTLVIKFRPGLDVENIAFLIALIAGTVLEDRLPFNKNVNMMLSFIITFVAFNAYLWLI